MVFCARLAKPLRVGVPTKLRRALPVVDRRPAHAGIHVSPRRISASPSAPPLGACDDGAIPRQFRQGNMTALALHQAEHAISWKFVDLRGSPWMCFTVGMSKSRSRRAGPGSGKTEAFLREALAQLAQKQQALQAEFAQLLQGPQATSAAIERTQREINRLAARQTQLVAELRLTQFEAPDRYGAHGGLVGQRPMRELVLDILDELGVPSPPRVISDFAMATHGYALPAERFASLRRDEERAYRKAPAARPAWVVPAINALGLTAIARIVAHSAWEPGRRIIGSRTLRTNHLRTLLALLRSAARVEGRPSPQLAALIARYAESVPGALTLGKPADYARIRESAEAELACIEPSDLEERRAAARRLGELPEPYQLWGCPALIETEAQRRRSSV